MTSVSGCGVRGAGCGVRGAGCGVRGAGSEVRRPRSGVRGPRFEIRDPRSEVRGATSEVRDRIKDNPAMIRYGCLCSLVVVSLTLVSAQQPAPSADLLARARTILTGSPIIDGHNDYPWALREHDPARDLDKLDIRQSQPGIMTDIPRLKAGGVGGQFWSVYVPVDLQGQGAVTATMEEIDTVHRMMRKYPETFE